MDGLVRNVWYVLIALLARPDIQITLAYFLYLDLD